MKFLCVNAGSSSLKFQLFEMPEEMIQGINTEKSFEKRAEYYCAHLLNHNVPSGLKWQEVPKVYQISVLKFIREKKCEKEIFHYKFRSNII